MEDDCLHSLEIKLTGSLSDFSVLKSKPFRRINSLLSDSHIFDNAFLFLTCILLKLSGVRSLFIFEEHFPIFQLPRFFRPILGGSLF